MSGVSLGLVVGLLFIAGVSCLFLGGVFNDSPKKAFHYLYLVAGVLLILTAFGVFMVSLFHVINWLITYGPALRGAVLCSPTC